MVNKNALAGPVNCKKTTRHYAHLSLHAKSRKTNDAKSKKWPKNSIWAIFFDDFKVKYLLIVHLLKNRFHSNWRPYLVAVFEKNFNVPDFGLIWTPFHEYNLQVKIFFQKSGSETFYLYSPPTSCKKLEKSLELFLKKLRYQPTNQPINQLLPTTPIL